MLSSVFDLRFLVSVCGALLLLTGIKLVLRVCCDFSAFLFFLDFLSDVLMLSVLYLVFVVGDSVLFVFLLLLDVLLMRKFCQCFDVCM